jgi:hypothetical protein
MENSDGENQGVEKARGMNYACHIITLVPRYGIAACFAWKKKLE